MRNLKSIGFLFLTFILSLGLCHTAFAAVEDTGFSDVDVHTWYAKTVEYCVEHNLMSGTSATIFDSNTPMSRAMLATVLYQAEGRPAVTENTDFADLAANSWYSDAVAWAIQNEIISGYGNNLFGPNNPVTLSLIHI